MRKPGVVPVLQLVPGGASFRMAIQPSLLRLQRLGRDGAASGWPDTTFPRARLLLLESVQLRPLRLVAAESALLRLRLLIASLASTSCTQPCEGRWQRDVPWPQLRLFQLVQLGPGRLVAVQPPLLRLLRRRCPVILSDLPPVYSVAGARASF